MVIKKALKNFSALFLFNCNRLKTRIQNMCGIQLENSIKTYQILF